MAEDETSQTDYKWQPITDLSDNWQSLGVPELASLATVWAEQREQLEESQALKQFNDRLMRQWSIETGIIERIYTLDRGVTQVLVEQGIDAALIPHWSTDVLPSDLVLVLQDHCEAVEGLFDFVASRQGLTISFIRQLHQVLTRHQEFADAVDQFGNLVSLPLERGNWKKLPNNPTRPDGTVHEYCPPEQVVGEMERLLAYHASHDNVSPEIESAWLHHRFAQIHPFQDGNGRVARALATMVFLGRVVPSCHYS